MRFHPRRFGAAVAGLVLLFGLLQGTFVADAATTSTWTGGGSSPNWSDAGNWVGGVIPSSGGDLVFPAVSQTTSYNDITGLSLHSITVQAANYNLDGNRVTLNDATLTVRASSDIRMPVTVTFPHSLAVQVTADANTVYGYYRIWDLSGDGAVSASAASGLTNPMLYLGPFSSFSGRYSSDDLGLTVEYVPKLAHPDIALTRAWLVEGIGGIGQLSLFPGPSRPTILAPAEGYNAACNPAFDCGGTLQVKTLSASGPYKVDITVNASGAPEPYGKLVLAAGAGIDLTSVTLESFHCATGALQDRMTVVHHLDSDATTGTFARIDNADAPPDPAQTVDHPAEGAVVPFCGRKYWITYRGGAFHNDVVLTRLPSGYVLDRYGSLHQYGPSPAVADSTHAHWPGWDIARGLAVRADRKSGYTLDGWGGVHAFGGAPNRAAGAYWQGWDIARGLALRPDGTSGYTLDGWGGLHGFGGAPDPAPSAYWQGWDIARGVALDPTDGTGSRGYVLDAYGGVHAFGGAKLVRDIDHAYWSGWNIARGLVVTGDGQGYTLDGWGGVHGFGGLPDPVTSSYWQGWDIARGISWDPVARGGYVVDGWGGLHVFSADAQRPVPAQAGSAYWPGRDLTRQVD